MTFKFPNVSKIMGSRLLTAALLAGPSLAMAQEAGGGLNRVKSGLTTFATQLETLVQIVGAIGLIFVGVGMGLGYSGLANIGLIAGGLLIAGSARDIADIFF